MRFFKPLMAIGFACYLGVFAAYGIGDLFRFRSVGLAATPDQWRAFTTLALALYIGLGAILRSEGFPWRRYLLASVLFLVLVAGHLALSPIWEDFTQPLVELFVDENARRFVEHTRSSLLIGVFFMVFYGIGLKRGWWW